MEIIDNRETTIVTKRVRDIPVGTVFTALCSHQNEIRVYKYLMLRCYVFVVLDSYTHYSLGPDFVFTDFQERPAKLILE